MRFIRGRRQRGAQGAQIDYRLVSRAARVNAGPDFRIRADVFSTVSANYLEPALR